MNQNDFPNNVEIEKQVLGAMLIRDGEIIPKLLNIINADDFYRPEHRVIFKHIVQLYCNGVAPDVVSLIEDIMNSEDAKGIDLSYVHFSTSWTFTNAYALHHAKIVKEKSDLRKIILSARFLIDDAQKGLKSVSDIISNYHATLENITLSSQPSKSLQISPYFAHNLKNDIANLKDYANRKTDFSNIDQHQFFAPGLYVIGATPAAGKTTFCWQLLEQLAYNGESCIFCSYEMSALELFTKTTARNLFLRDKSSSLTAADIRRGGWTNELDNIIDNVANSNLNLQVLELQDESIDDLLNLIRPLCTNSRKAPIVCLDYLQIVPHNKDNIKLGIDDSVRKLKKFQRDTNTTFIVISSFNRTNYNQSVSFESFKESGGIEYSADVVWALQLYVMNEIKGGADISNTRKKIDDAKKIQPRQIHLKCLKNRQGSNYDCFFNYFSAHDYFEPCNEFEDTKPAKNDNDRSHNERKIKNDKF